MVDNAGVVRTRRSVLAASLGGLLAAAASALGHPRAAEAADGDPVVLGATLTATTATTISNTANLNGVLHLNSLGTALSAVSNNATANAVQGESDGADGVGVWGRAPDGIGIGGSSVSGTGVDGGSQYGPGVSAASAHGNAIEARAYGGGAGVYGFSGQEVPPTPPPITGVFGYSTGTPDGPLTGAVGVHGKATVGTGVLAEAATGGTALRVLGKVALSRSGTLTIAAGRTSVSKSVSGLTSSSLVFAVVQAGDGKAWVRKVSPAPGSFTVLLNKAASSTTTIAWFALG